MCHTCFIPGDVGCAVLSCLWMDDLVVDELLVVVVVVVVVVSVG